MRTAIRCLLIAAALTVFGAALAQGYPAKPVRVIVPHGAGGPIDVLVRGLGQYLQQSLGQPFIVDNRGGGDGIAGAEACARAAPDGYVLCATATNVVTIGPSMHTRLPYDPPRDYVAVARVGILDSALVVHPSVPANSVKELIDLARARPESIGWASFGPNTSSYMYMEWLRKLHGAPFLHVPYKTAIQSQNATVAGEVQVNLYAAGQAAALAKAGKLKVLAVTGDKPSPFLPGVPPFKEAGIDLPWRTWFGVFAPAGTPREVVQRLNAEINRTVASAQYVQKFLTTQGITPAPGTPEDFSAFLKSDRELFARMMKVIGVKPVD
jgi:tripartite-type tricarboxylate transporter receptor subunit TctC